MQGRVAIGRWGLVVKIVHRPVSLHAACLALETSRLGDKTLHSPSAQHQHHHQRQQHLQHQCKHQHIHQGQQHLQHQCKHQHHHRYQHHHHCQHQHQQYHLWHIVINITTIHFLCIDVTPVLIFFIKTL